MNGYIRTDAATNDSNPILHAPGKTPLCLDLRAFESQMLLMTAPAICEAINSAKHHGFPEIILEEQEVKSQVIQLTA